MDIKVKLEDIYNLSALEHTIKTGMDEIESDDGDMYDTYDGDGKEIVVETVVSGAYGVFQAEGLIEMLGIKVEMRDFIEMRTASGVTYLPEVWEEVLDPVMGDIADQISDHFKLPENVTLYFANNEDDGAYDMFLHKSEEG